VAGFTRKEPVEGAILNIHHRRIANDMSMT
jgi:hypothetical protein